MKASRQASRAFSLTELLIVVAITAVLVALLLPALSRAREVSKRVACANRQRQLYHLLVMYAQDNSSWLPPNYAPSQSVLPYRLWVNNPSPSLPGKADTNSSLGLLYSAMPQLEALPANLWPLFYCPTRTDTFFTPGPRTTAAGYQTTYYRYYIGDSAMWSKPFTGVVMRGSGPPSEKFTPFEFTADKALLMDTVLYPTGNAAGEVVPIHGFTGLNATYGDGHVSFVATGTLHYFTNDSVYTTFIDQQVNDN